MFSSAEKTTRNVTAVQQKEAGTTFFRKAGDDAFFGTKDASTFFGKPVQAKLNVSHPDDPQEKEADAVADKVMRSQDNVHVMASPFAGNNSDRNNDESLSRKEEKELHAKLETVSREEEKHIDSKRDVRNVASEANTIQTKPTSLYHASTIQRSGRDPPQSSIQFENQLAASKGTGSKMPDNTRMFMENRFGADFSNVSVHNNAGAEQMCTHVQAKAFAHGSDIYFNKQQYSPHSADGSLLLAHELTHTIQQGASPATNTISRRSFFDTNLSDINGGSMLPSEARDYFDDSYHVDVSDIRTHNDMEAMAICRSHNVAAFAQGKHIFLDPSKYSADSEEGASVLVKQVADSLKQRSMGQPDMMGMINAAIASAKKNAAAAKKSAAKKEEPTKTKDKKKGPAGKEKKGGKGKDAGGKKKGKRKPAQGDGPAFKLVKPKPGKSPAIPQEDAAFHKVVDKTKAAARNQKSHVPAEAKAADAQKAAVAVPNEADSKAKNRKTDTIDDAGKKDLPFDEAGFKADLLKKIEEATPNTLEDATEFKDHNKVGDVKNAMGEKVAHEKEQTTGPVAKATAKPLQVNEADNKHPVPLAPTLKGAMPAGVGAPEAAPKPKLLNEISLQQQSKSLDDEMKANNVTEEQLAKSNEPSFNAALAEKKGAQKDALQRPVQYKKDEAGMLKEAKDGAQADAVKSVVAMNTARGKNFESVVQHQQTGKKNDEERRTNVAKDIEEKYKIAEEKVNKSLTEADTEANKIFDEGAEAARQQFENYVDEKMTAYKRKRYSGFWGGLRWAKDKLFGMPDAVNAFYTQGRQMYLNKMDLVISKVASLVTAKLNEAKQAIKDGKKSIDDYVKKLPKDLADVGKEAAENIQDKFDNLEQSVNDKREQLIEGLSKKYVDNVKKLDDRIEEMKEANKGLVDKAIGFLKKVWQVIKDLTNLFTSILSRLASIIGTILSNPGGFFDNVGKAFKQGLDQFKNKFLDYLEKGLMEWLSINLGIAGIELPQKFDVMAIFTLVLQVLGISKQHLKERAVALLGAKTVEAMETAGGILYRVYNEGLGVLWDMIYEKLTDLKDIVWDAIKSFIQTKVIEAAIVFVLSLLNPIGAFVKVCMAIYDFLMMLVRFKDRILELLDSILGAVIDIASGSIGGAANKIENAFAKSVSVIIGFLAALLHLNDIAAKVRDIVNRIRTKVDKGIDWVIQKGAALVKKIGGVFKPTPKEKGKEEYGPEKQVKINEGIATMHSEQEKYMKDGKISIEDAETVAHTVKKRHAVFSSFTAIEAGDTVEFVYTASARTVAGSVPRSKRRCFESGKKAPNIGNISKHGKQGSSLRKGEKLLWLESEHVLPFATGKTLWQALALYLPERGWSEDNQQTTIMIYYKAARIKTPADNIVSGQFKRALRSLNISEQFNIQRVRYQAGDRSALSEGSNILQSVLAPFKEAKQTAISRTNKAIKDEHGFVERGCSKTNGERRGETSPLPSSSDVSEAADQQYDDVLRLVTKELLSVEKMRQRMEARGLSKY
ncbi:eCIS core domain-containing protein [Pinibacter aurantiacus]|uniref:DUF4157 domain-containing protein n=1 Tax=Pinibacter aurantiacus TaxID=2851599 RepID=A0A9E2SGT4_9BACT|nr:DUF4157 domain-containing protein [Pinibacter aurantiacus]MBV4360535.1 DUF4157 domain-containing protein [Pinibacter aurantiacus]